MYWNDLLKLKESQARTELKVQELYASQSDLLSRYISSRRDIEELRSEFFFKRDKEDVYVFNAPATFPWFTGRIRQIKEIEVILKSDEQLHQSSARKAANCGLGGSGKTSLAVEYAHHMKKYYQGGVFWFSGEDGTKLGNYVNSLALSIGIFDVTLSQTLARISRSQNSWLLIIDDMDELQLSPSVRKLLSAIMAILIIVTRRKPSTLVNEVQAFRDSSCLELRCR